MVTDKDIEAIRHNDMKHLNGRVYMDYMGSGMYTDSQIERVRNELQTTFYCNPHSVSQCSLNSSSEIEKARDAVLSLFNTDRDQYSVIFTSGDTAALKLIGESFPFTEKSTYAYLSTNHNSVLGVREYALERGAQFLAVPDNKIGAFVDGTLNERVAGSGVSSTGTGWGTHTLMKGLGANTPPTSHYGHSLFVYPPEENFSGSKFPLDWINAVETSTRMGYCDWSVMIDAAAFAAKNRIDLTRYRPSFMSVSFYKMLGYPTGLGALLVRNDKRDLLVRRYFGGGTVLGVTPMTRYTRLRSDIESRFEDGTVNFLDIIALKHGFSEIKRLGGMDEISVRTFAHARRLYEALALLHYPSGAPVLRIFGNWRRVAAEPNVGKEIQGATVSFAVMNSDGSLAGFNNFNKLATEAGFDIRAGSHCNPGKLALEFNLHDAEIISAADEGKSCMDTEVGAVRISLGPHTLSSDIDRFIEFARQTLPRVIR